MMLLNHVIKRLLLHILCRLSLVGIHVSLELILTMRLCTDWCLVVTSYSRTTYGLMSQWNDLSSELSIGASHVPHPMNHPYPQPVPIGNHSMNSFYEALAKEKKEKQMVGEDIVRRRLELDWRAKSAPPPEKLSQATQTDASVSSAGYIGSRQRPKRSKQSPLLTKYQQQQLAMLKTKVRIEELINTSSYLFVHRSTA